MSASVASINQSWSLAMLCSFLGGLGKQLVGDFDDFSVLGFLAELDQELNVLFVFLAEEAQPAECDASVLGIAVVDPVSKEVQASFEDAGIFCKVAESADFIENQTSWHAALFGGQFFGQFIETQGRVSGSNHLFSPCVGKDLSL